MGDAAAQKKCRDRLGKIKQLQEAANFKPKGTYDVMKDFLDKGIEVKIQVSVKERKHLNQATGKYDIATGIMDNQVVKYLPLFR